MPTPATRTPRRRSQPRTKPGEERRRDLLDAALAVFTRRGVLAATLDEVVRDAGVAKGTFYLYFQSKDQLLLGLQRDFETTLVDRIDAAVAAAGDGWDDRLDAWVQAVFDDFPTSRALHDVLYHHPVGTRQSTATASDQPAHRDLVASLTDLITDGIAAGAYHVDDAELTAALLCGAVHRAFDRIWHREEMDDTPRLIAAARQLFHRAVGVPSRTPRHPAHPAR